MSKLANRISLRVLNYFVSTAKSANLSRAARDLHLAQPALSRQIRALEATLGLDLFHRLPHGMQLTPAGERLLQHAYAIFERVRLMEDDMEQLARGHDAAIEVGLSPVAMDIPHVQMLLRDQSRDDPDVRMTLSAGASESQVEALLAGRQDVGFLFLEQPHPLLHLLLLTEQRLVLGMHAEHPLAKLDRVGVADLAAHAFVTTTKFHNPRLDALLAAHGVLPRVAQETDDTKLLLQLVSSGIGVAFVNSAWERGQTDGLLLRAVDGVDIPLPLFLAHRRDERRPEVLRFVRRAREIAQAASGTAPSPGDEAAASRPRPERPTRLTPDELESCPR